MPVLFNIVLEVLEEEIKGIQTGKEDPTIPLLGIYPEKTIIQKDTCPSVFTAGLFTIARTWKQPKFPSTEEEIKKLWYTYTWNITQPLT